VFVLDTKKEHIAVTEANKLKIPLIAVVDTNCDPDVVDYVIPGNDDAIRSGSLLCRVMADAVKEGRFIRSKKVPSDSGPVAPAEAASPEAAATETPAEAVAEDAAEAAVADESIPAPEGPAPEAETAETPETETTEEG